jgi:hypothetical protein
VPDLCRFGAVLFDVLVLIFVKGIKGFERAR